jgi:hypothetical protein
MCRDHPIHSLYQVIALGEQPPHGQPASDSTSLNATLRRETAKKIYHRATQKESQGRMVMDMRELVRTSLEWANYVTTEGPNDKKKHKCRTAPDGRSYIMPEIKLKKIRNSLAPVMTCHFPVEKTMQYKDYAQVTQFDSIFAEAGGMNAPKITTCIGSDGVKYKQLVSIGSSLKTVSADHDLRSSKEPMTTSARTQLWSKFLSLSTKCCIRTGQRKGDSSVSGVTKSSHWCLMQVLACWSLSVIHSLSRNGSL